MSVSMHTLIAIAVVLFIFCALVWLFRNLLR